MKPMKKIEFALESFKNIQELIKFIDQKSGAVLVVAGFIFTGYFEFFKELSLKSVCDANLLEILVCITSFTTIGLLIITIYISIFLVLKPRLAKNYSNNDFSLFYFEHLSSLGKEETHNNYKNLDESKMEQLVIDQQFEVSKILESKIKYLGISFNFLFFTIISMILFILFLNQI